MPGQRHADEVEHVQRPGLDDAQPGRLARLGARASARPASRARRRPPTRTPAGVGPPSDASSTHPVLCRRRAEAGVAAGAQVEIDLARRASRRRSPRPRPPQRGAASSSSRSIRSVIACLSSRSIEMRRATEGLHVCYVARNQWVALYHAERRHHATRADGRRADRPRRALVRHLLAAAERPGRVPRRPGRRGDGQPDRRPARPSRVRRPRQGHPPLHQFPRRLDLRRPGDLRHDAVHPPRRADDLLRDRDVDGLAAARRRRARASGWRCPTAGS